VRPASYFAVPMPRRSIDPRRQPSQDRGRARVANILDAADEVFFEQGYQAATTDAIAKRAGASIGSIYQFFPNKAALFRALALRYLEEIRGIYLSLAAGGAMQAPLEELVERVITEFAAFHRRKPGFRQLMMTSIAIPELLAAAEDVHREFELGVQQILELRARKLTPQRRSVVAASTVAAFSALIWTATRGDSGFEKRVIAEAKLLVSRYLKPEISEPKRATAR
jgi:AcrR family transcriptional regulator